jgi:nuclear pore complex protein Nup93
LRWLVILSLSFEQDRSLSQVDEDEDGGLQALAHVLLGYGERHFDGTPKQQGSRRGVWAGVLLMCGQFERVRHSSCLPSSVTCLPHFPGRGGSVGTSGHGSGSRTSCYCACISWFTSCPVARGDVRYDTQYESGFAFPWRLTNLIKVSLSPLSPPALSLPTLIWRYVRQFVKIDAKEALQYVYCVCLAADQGEGIGKEQLEIAWELIRRIIVLGNGGPAWEELVGGFRPDGSRFVSTFIYGCLTHFFTFGQNGIIEQGATLLQLKDSKQFNEQILVRAAKHSEENDRISEAIKLYNLAEDYSTVISCLAQSLGNTITQPSPDEKARVLEKVASEVLRHYERMNRAVGKDRDAVVRLLRIREAMDAKHAGRPEVALDVWFFSWYRRIARSL